MKRKLNLMIALSTVFAMFLGCGEIRSKPQKWAKAKPLTERLDYPSALQNDEKFIYFVTGGTVASKNEGTNNVLKIPVGGGVPTVLFKGGEIIPDGQASAMDEKFIYFSGSNLRHYFFL